MTSSKYKKKYCLTEFLTISNIVFNFLVKLYSTLRVLSKTKSRPFCRHRRAWMSFEKKNHFVKNVSFSCKKSYTVLFSWSMLYLCWKHFISYIPYQNIPYQFKYHADFFFLNLLKTFIQVKTTFSSITLSGRHSERH